tara:strand:- start:259 stop:1329 length:1071 start_codon:yes stop_codon:yes gene_type:complete
MSFRHPENTHKQSVSEAAIRLDGNRKGGIERVNAASTNLRLLSLEREVEQTKGWISRLHEQMSVDSGSKRKIAEMEEKDVKPPDLLYVFDVNKTIIPSDAEFYRDVYLQVTEGTQQVSKKISVPKSEWIDSTPFKIFLNTQIAKSTISSKGLRAGVGLYTLSVDYPEIVANIKKTPELVVNGIDASAMFPVENHWMIVRDTPNEWFYAFRMPVTFDADGLKHASPLVDWGTTRFRYNSETELSKYDNPVIRKTPQEILEMSEKQKEENGVQIFKNENEYQQFVDDVSVEGFVFRSYYGNKDNHIWIPAQKIIRATAKTKIYDDARPSEKTWPSNNVTYMMCEWSNSAVTNKPEFSL